MLHGLWRAMLELECTDSGARVRVPARVHLRALTTPCLPADCRDSTAALAAAAGQSPAAAVDWRAGVALVRTPRQQNSAAATDPRLALGHPST